MSDMKMRWVVAVSVAVVLSAGCGRIDERKVYRIAREHVEHELGEDVDVSPMKTSLFAVGKNAARVDVDYHRGGNNPVEGYMTVWCKRIRMRWEFERATDSRTAGAATQ